MCAMKVYGIARAPVRDRKRILADVRTRAAATRTTEFSYVANPSYLFPAYELYPLAAKPKIPLQRLVGVVTDMDGTTTTTETLCIHSLEMMVRRMTGKHTPAQWRGFIKRDLPHIIGNSTTKHVEYLLSTYKKLLRPADIRKSFFYAALWTLAFGNDEARRQEVQDNVKAMGISIAVMERYGKVLARGRTDAALERTALRCYRQFGERLPVTDFTTLVRIGIDVYYQCYHAILEQLRHGRGEALTHITNGKPLIAPMPGVGIFLALLKGWLGSEAGKLTPLLVEDLHSTSAQRAGYKERLQRLGVYFQKHPVRIAVVTSSIFYEGDIVLTEVFRMLHKGVADWPLSTKRRRYIREYFKDYRSTYDAVVSASDSSEIRLKPHRDLYSIALHRLGVTPKDFSSVLGFEDSEPGLLAIRAAGVGMSVAVPFAQTRGHDFSSASAVLSQGLPEAILERNVFLPISRV